MRESSDVLRRVVDRSAVVVQSLHDEPDDRRWWWTRPVAERLAAIEIMRRTLYGRAAPLLTENFEESLRLLSANRVEYLLVGGYAVGLHGYPRATIALDAWVRATPDNAGRILMALGQFGFEAPVLEPHLFIDPRSIVRFGVPPFRIEVMTSIDGVECDACRSRAMELDLEVVLVPVISLADLKTNKRAAGRYKDLADLENLP